MGKGSAEIQRDIEYQRNALSRRIDDLDRRVRDDVEKSRGEAQARVESLADRAKGPATRAKDQARNVKDRASSLNERVEESPVGQHPNLLLAGSFATGVLLGVATGGREDGAREEPREPREARQFQGPEAPGRIERGLDSLISTVRAEALVMIRDFVDRAMQRGEAAAEETSEKVPAFLRSAWDNVSSRIEPDRPRPAARSASGARVEMRERDLPHDRPLSDLEERSAEEMGFDR
ncbi:MAG: hypothetical protein M0R74_06910 [Dehalococcoidia bacterium]|nr:hypothetical protein [Dehalococcoidia bacterium]